MLVLLWRCSRLTELVVEAPAASQTAASTNATAKTVAKGRYSAANAAVRNNKTGNRLLLPGLTCGGCGAWGVRAEKSAEGSPDLARS